MTKDEALKLALEAFDSMIGRKPERVEQAITAIKEVLAQPEQEPVAWIYKGGKSFDGNKYSDEYELTSSKQVALWKDKNAKPLYTTPQRTWVGLTDIDYAGLPLEQVGLIRWAEAKLKDKNARR